MKLSPIVEIPTPTRRISMLMSLTCYGEGRLECSGWFGAYGTSRNARSRCKSAGTDLVERRGQQETVNPQSFVANVMGYIAARDGTDEEAAADNREHPGLMLRLLLFDAERNSIEQSLRETAQVARRKRRDIRVPVDRSKGLNLQGCDEGDACRDDDVGASLGKPTQNEQ